MRQETTTRIIDLLREQIETQTGEAMISRLVSSMNEKDADMLVHELEEMSEYDDYLSETEARNIVAKFENFDGSRGAHWREPQTVFDAASSFGIPFESKDHYNKWAFYATMNMVWSDEWGILKKYISPEHEARVCAELAQSTLRDKDEMYSVRYYFRID